MQYGNIHYKNYENKLLKCIISNFNNLTVFIRCKVFKQFALLDYNKTIFIIAYRIRCNDNNITEHTITCEEWTDPYTGFSLIISEP